MTIPIATGIAAAAPGVAITVGIATLPVAITVGIAAAAPGVAITVGIATLPVAAPGVAIAVGIATAAPGVAITVGIATLPVAAPGMAIAVGIATEPPWRSAPPRPLIPPGPPCKTMPAWSRVVLSSVDPYPRSHGPRTRPRTRSHPKGG